MKRLRPVLSTLAFLGIAAMAGAEAITLPPSGDNQKCSVMQGIGLVRVQIDYSSPDVRGPGGEDRRGKIWGDLVPYGFSDLGFNDCKQCPWRAGANENTVLTVSHDVMFEGKPLKAGRYGLFMIPGKDEWTLVLSGNAHSWGAYSYDPSEDVLRVPVKPVKSEYHEWLTYEFDDRQPDHATCALKWEELAIPFQIRVPDMSGLYVAQIRRDLEGGKGFEWMELQAAAQYCLQNKVNLEEAAVWAEKAVSMPGVGRANSTTLGTLAQVQLAAGKQAEGLATLDRSLSLGGESAINLHQFARQLQGNGFKDAAMKVFVANAKQHPREWPVTLGLARGHDMMGDPKRALVYAKQAVVQAPDEPSRKNVQNFIATLEKKIAGN